MTDEEWDERFSMLYTVLCDIRALLAPNAEEKTDGCQHENKVDLSVPGNLGHWICPSCRYEHPGEKMS